MTIRIRFGKGPSVRFISHLDVMRTFERALRRAKIPIAFSEGFHPRPKVAYGPPLPLGMTSSGEYADYEIVGRSSPGELQTRLNAELPEGLRVLEAKEMAGPVRSLMAVIDTALYEIQFDGDANGVADAAFGILDSPILEVSRTRNGRERKVNIRPLIKKLEVVEEADASVISLLVVTGSAGNVRPQEVLTFLPVDIERARIHRSGLFVTKNGELISPLEVDSL